jgi:hypothetical protein
MLNRELIINELEIANSRMAINLIMEMIKAKKIPIFMDLSFIESMVDSQKRIEIYEKMKFDQLAKANPDIKINEAELMVLILLGVSAIKFIDDVIKIKFNHRPSEEIEKSAVNFFSNFLSTEIRESISNTIDRIGLDKNMLIDGFKQFIYMSAILLTDTYLSDDGKDKSINYEIDNLIKIGDLAIVSSAILICEKKLLKGVKNFIDKTFDFNEQGNAPQVHNQAIPAHQIQPALQAHTQAIPAQPARPVNDQEIVRQQIIRSLRMAFDELLARQALRLQQTSSQPISSVTQDLAPLSPRDNQSGVQASIASQSSGQRLIVNAAPSSTHGQSLRIRLVNQNGRES